MSFKVIGFGGKIGAGKSTAANFAFEVALAESGMRYLLGSREGFPIKQVAFADALKRMATEQFGWDGIKDDKGRRLLQTLGAAGRAYDEDFWVKELAKSLDGFRGLVIVSDLRYPNEVEWCRRYGRAIHLVGPYRGDTALGDANHESETQLNVCNWSDVEMNTGSLATLRSLVSVIVDEVCKTL